jgi:hypothetical protein
MTRWLTDSFRRRNRQCSGVSLTRGCTTGSASSRDASVRCSCSSQLDPAGVVVHHDQVEQSVSVHVGHGHRPRAAVDLDDLHRVEAEVP